MKLSSTGCFVLAVTWLLVSLLWFLWVKNTAIGVVWLIVGAAELAIAFIMHHKEKRKEKRHRAGLNSILEAKI